MAEIDITFGFTPEETLFRSFRLSLESHSHVLILAEPGKGKTTLAKILTGSVPKYSGGTLSGHFIVNGNDILSKDISERMEYAGRVSQNTDEMMLFSSVQEELSFPLENMGLCREEMERRMADALSLFGLERYRDVSTSELSGGEKRRLMLAVLFAIDPAIYILDESFDELSPSWRGRLAEIIRNLDRTVIAFGSHELSEYDGMFDKVITIGNDGDAVPYVRKDIPVFSLPSGQKNGMSLSVSDLVIRREHRSSDELPSFGLTVPSFELHGGECVVLTGENGSGKSSFSRVLSGLLKEQSGSVTCGGTGIPYKERRHMTAYLMQNPYEELFLPTVSDELSSTGASEKEISEALELFALDGHEYVQEMSYGRAKMLQAALFFLLSRPFAIFDELDSALSTDDFIKAVRVYLEKGTGLIVITHDMNVSAMLPGRHFMIEGGTLHEC